MSVVVSLAKASVLRKMIAAHARQQRNSVSQTERLHVRGWDMRTGDRCQAAITRGLVVMQHVVEDR